MSFSIEEPLYNQLETLVKEAKYTNRSEFVRDMIRDNLVERQWKHDRECLGTVTLVYNHNLRQLGEKLTKVQHHHHRQILAATHVHLDEELCAEVVIIKGKAREIQHVADELRQQKGVLHTTVSMSTTGKRLA
jgi:CopG family nickel-responsive transcriptional regulator